MTTREPQRPVPPASDYDPAQLSFGDVAAVPQLRVERQAEESQGADGFAVVTFREPSVCGESSYDDLDAAGAGPGWSARVVQEAEPASARVLPAAPSRTVGAAGAAGAAGSAGSAGFARSAGFAGSGGTAGFAGSAGFAGAAVPAAAPRGVAAPRATASARPEMPAPRPSSMPESMTAPSRPTPVALPSASLDPLQRATELSPRDVEAAIVFAHALDKHGNAAGALAALDACLASGGDELRLICARVFLLGSRLKYDQAESELRRATKLRADDPEVLLQAGILACRRARWRDAVEPLQRAATQRADDALAHFYLGEALNHVDQLAAALAAYERASVLDPSGWRAFKGVGIVLDRLARPADAAVAYRRMREAQGR